MLSSTIGALAVTGGALSATGETLSGGAQSRPGQTAAAAATSKSAGSREDVPKVMVAMAAMLLGLFTVLRVEI